MNTSQAITPYLCSARAAEAISFYIEAFGAREHYRMTGTDGRINHAELEIGGSTFYLSDESPEQGIRSPLALDGHAVSFVLAVMDAGAAMAQALGAGAALRHPLTQEPYGQIGTLVDPFGHHWQIWQPDPAYQPPE